MDLDWVSKLTSSWFFDLDFVKSQYISGSSHCSLCVVPRDLSYLHYITLWGTVANSLVRSACNAGCAVQGFTKAVTV